MAASAKVAGVAVSTVDLWLDRQWLAALEAQGMHLSGMSNRLWRRASKRIFSIPPMFERHFLG
jgi:hypothetical protein